MLPGHAERAPLGAPGSHAIPSHARTLAARTQNNFLVGRKFQDFDHANREAIAWCDNINAASSRKLLSNYLYAEATYTQKASGFRQRDNPPIPNTSWTSKVAIRR